MITPSSQTLIRKLRAPRGVRDLLAWQLHLSRALSVAELHPRDLPPSAILCIQTLRDRALDAWSWDPHALRPPARWEHAMRAALEELARGAARPAHEMVPTNAQAVLFYDRAELLACLARDWLRGDLITQWWWRSMFRLDDVQRLVLSEWLRAHEYTPAALYALAATGDAVPFVRTFDESTTRAFLHAITRQFGLGAILTSLEQVERKRESALTPNLRSLSSDRQPVPFSPGISAPTSTITGASTPFHRWAPEADTPELALAHRVLLGIALMLQRAPAQLRTQTFAAAFEEWYARVLDSARVDSPPAQEALAPATTLGASAPQAAPMTTAKHGAPRGPMNENRAASVEDWRPDESLVELAGGPVASVTRKEQLLHTELQTQSGLHLRPARNDPFAAHAPTPAPEQVLSADAERTTQTIVAHSIHTKYGGVFYLINLALYLNLYGDFSTPLEPGLELSPWDWIAFVGREFIGEKFLDDPVWMLLAQLAGREANDSPGKDFVPPTEWRMSTAWLKPFPEKTDWKWTRSRKRLRVIHPAGFVVLDIARTSADVETQLQRELNAYQPSHVAKRGVGNVQSSLVIRPSSPIARWLAWLVPYLRARLQRAMGVEAEELARSVCEHSARVAVTATHVDVMLSLAELPIEIRYAGLDRDPGWVPAAGRFITFHFD